MARDAITMKDVAKEAGVSIKTVSNVINGADDQMRPATRRRVLKAIDKLGYQVNHSAQALKRGRTGVIGLAVPNFDQPFIGYMADQVTAKARERGYGIMISTYGQLPERLDSFAAAAPKLNADGWIMMADGPLQPESATLNQPYPTVLVGDYSAHGLRDMITMPNVDAARHVTSWLLDRGARRIGFIGADIALFDDPSITDTQRLKATLAADEGNTCLRLQGFAQALQTHDLAVDWDLVMPCERLTSGDGAAATFALLEREKAPDALVCVNDAVAIGALSALAKLHFDVPNDVQVTGMDDIPDDEFSVPPLTTIDSRVDQYAELAVDMLIKRIEGDTEPPSVYTSGFRLLQRESTRE